MDGLNLPLNLGRVLIELNGAAAPAGCGGQGQTRLQRLHQLVALGLELLNRKMAVDTHAPMIGEVLRQNQTN